MYYVIRLFTSYHNNASITKVLTPKWEKWLLQPGQDYSFHSAWIPGTLLSKIYNEIYHVIQDCKIVDTSCSMREIPNAVQSNAKSFITLAESWIELGMIKPILENNGLCGEFVMVMECFEFCLNLL